MNWIFFKILLLKFVILDCKKYFSVLIKCLNQQKMYLLCTSNEIKKASRYLYKHSLMILKLSNFGFKELNFFAKVLQYI